MTTLTTTLTAEKLKMIGLKVTFHLASCMTDPSNPIHLDALLAWARTAMDLESFTTMEECIGSLPLESVSHGLQTIWKASKLNFDLRGGRVGVETKRMFLRKTEVQEMANLKAEDYFQNSKSSGFKANPFNGDQLDGGSGWARNFQEFYPVKDYITATAYCVGDKEQVERLLSAIKWIGKRGSRGHGKVVKIEVSENKEAQLLWVERAMSTECLEELNLDKKRYYPSITNVNNPYWDVTTKTSAWLPRPDSFQADFLETEGILTKKAA